MLDFDGDGISDITVFEDQADGSPNELVFTHRESSTGDVSSSVEFGKSSDIPALGDYDGDLVTDYVVVREEDSVLKWVRKGKSGNTSTTLGRTDDFVITGCDYDDDGGVDPAVYRSGEGIYYLNYLNEEVNIPVSLNDGDVPVKVACADLDNDGNRETLFALHTESGYRLAIFGSDGKRVFQTAISEPTNIFVYDSNDDDLFDIGMYRKKRRRAFMQTLVQGKKFTFSRKRTKLKGGKRTSSAMALYDGEKNSWELLFHGKGGSFFSRNEATGRVVRSSLSSIRGDELLSPHTLESTGTSPVDDPNELCSTIEDMPDGANGRLWKPSEQGGLVVLFPQCDFRASSVLISYRGKTLYNMEYAGPGNPDSCGDRIHFRARDRNPGSFPSGLLLVVTSTKKKTYCFQVNGNTGSRID